MKTKQINVLFLLPSNNIGGAEISALNLIKYLSKNGHNIFIAIPFKKNDNYIKKLKPFVKEIMYMNFMQWSINFKFSILNRIINFFYRSLKSNGWFLTPFFKILKFSKRNNIDIIYTNTISTFDGAIASKILGLPHILHLREITGIGNNSIMYLPFQKYPLVFNFITEFFPSFVIYNSKYTKSASLKFFSKSQNKIIYNSLDDHFFEEKNSTKVRKKTKVIGIVANVVPLKNHMLFLKIAKLFLVKFPKINVSFRIYGNVPDNDYTRKIKSFVINKKLTSKVKFMGLFTDSVSIYKDIDILLHTNNKESFGRIFIEAMAMGVPVVTLGGGVSDELIDNYKTGFLISDENPQEYINIIHKLITNNELYSEVKKNAKIFSKYFKNDILSKEIEYVIKNIYFQKDE